VKLREKHRGVSDESDRARILQIEGFIDVRDGKPRALAMVLRENKRDGARESKNTGSANATPVIAGATCGT
jgi:hypothetical protein